MQPESRNRKGDVITVNQSTIIITCYLLFAMHLTTQMIVEDFFFLCRIKGENFGIPILDILLHQTPSYTPNKY